jgi:arabinogalactan oligomer/maltooligosaccharide transport system permease protein
VERERAKRPAPSFAFGLVLKLFLLAAVNGLTLASLPRIIDQKLWLALAFVLFATIATDLVYLRRDRFLPAKYLLPATILLLAFQVYPVFYTLYVSTTNYSTSHNVSKDQAIKSILANSELPTADAPRFAAAPFADSKGALALFLTDSTGAQFLGTSEGLAPVDPATLQKDANGKVVAVGDFHRLSLAEILPRQTEILAIRIPAPDLNGSIKLATVSSATLVVQSLRYDPSTDQIVNIETGKTYSPVQGEFVSSDGAVLAPGWRVVIGFGNFTKVFTSSAIRGPFLRAFIWNYVFATLTVFMQFGLGLAIAIALSHPKLRLKRVYRSILVIPFALPSYLTALVWAGLLNQRFGAVNRLLHTDLNWLGDPNLAKVSILLVTMWLGFPYFFLVSTGALTAIPSELTEAASVDGASGFYTFRSIKLPLLMITLAPLLISSFAFNFNNFNAIYLLTGGGPPIQGAQTPAGHTDILITYTYRLAFESGRGSEYGFAAAISVLIFIMVMAISIISFRATKTLEQVR